MPRAGKTAVGGRLRQRVGGGLQREPAGFHLVAQRVPRVEAVLTGHDRLRVVQLQVVHAAPRPKGRSRRQRGEAAQRLGVADLRVAQQTFGLFFRCSREGRSGSWRDGDMRPPCWGLWFADRQHGGTRAVESIDGAVG